MTPTPFNFPAVPLAQSTATYWLALLFGIVSTCIYLLTTSDAIYHYTPDTVAYVEASANLANGRGLTITPGVADISSDATPLRLFPPGFALGIAGLSVLGIAPADGALMLAWLSWALLPAALLFCLAPATGRTAALVIAALVVFSPGVILTGRSALSDVPFLILVLLSFGMLLRSLQSPRTTTLLLASGATLGAAYWMRNAAVAAILAVTATFVLMAALRALSLRESAVRMIAWGAGLALVITPLLARNYVHFGSFQPYEMPASDVGLITNIRTFVAALFHDLSGSSTFGRAIGWDIRALIAVGAALLALAAYPLMSTWNKRPLAAQAAIILLAGYFAFGAAMVIYARTKYQWGEPINLRHVIQYTWIIPALITAAYTTAPKRRATHAALAAVTVLFMLRAQDALADYDHQARMTALLHSAPPAQAVAQLPDPGWIMTGPLKKTYFSDTRLAQFVGSLPSNTYLVSNYADVLRLSTGRQIRFLYDCENASSTLERLAARAAERPIVAILLPRNEDLKMHGSWTSRCYARTPSGYKALVVNGRYLIWAHSLAVNGTSFLDGDLQWR